MYDKCQSMHKVAMTRVVVSAPAATFCLPLLPQSCLSTIWLTTLVTEELITRIVYLRLTSDKTGDGSLQRKLGYTYIIFHFPVRDKRRKIGEKKKTLTLRYRFDSTLWVV